MKAEKTTLVPVCKCMPCGPAWVYGVMALQVMSLRPRFQVAAQQAQSEGASEDDIEAIKGMARLFAELGESYVGLLAQGVAPGHCTSTLFFALQAASRVSLLTVLAFLITHR